MAFGEKADGTPYTPLDIVGHEMMHGVTSFSADLRNQWVVDLGPEQILLSSGPADCGNVRFGRNPFWCVDGRFVLASNHAGALHEGFSDVFGTAVEFLFHEPGDGPLKGDYVLGEDLPSGPNRSLESPRSLIIDGPVLYPDHLSRRLRFAIVIFDDDRYVVVPIHFLDDLGNYHQLRSHDSGGVHMNATIIGHAFYLAIEGGENATSGLMVQGVGAANREQIERVFFRAMTELMPSSATFTIAPAVLFQSARDLFGDNSSVTTAVLQALLAVGF